MRLDWKCARAFSVHPTSAGVNWRVAGCARPWGERIRSAQGRAGHTKLAADRDCAIDRTAVCDYLQRTSGRLTQRKSATFTRWKPQVQSLQRPPRKTTKLCRFRAPASRHDPDVPVLFDEASVSTMPVVSPSRPSLRRSRFLPCARLRPLLVRDFLRVTCAQVKAEQLGQSVVRQDLGSRRPLFR